jgi:hypothetical protein
MKRRQMRNLFSIIFTTIRLRFRKEISWNLLKVFQFVGKTGSFDTLDFEESDIGRIFSGSAYLVAGGGLIRTQPDH